MQPLYFLFPVFTFVFCGLTSAVIYFCWVMALKTEYRTTYSKIFARTLAVLLIIALGVAWTGYTMVVIDYGVILAAQKGLD